MQQHAHAQTYWALMNKHLYDSADRTPELTTHFLRTFNTTNKTQAESMSMAWTEHASNVLWPCSFDKNASTVRCSEVLPCDAARLNLSGWGAAPLAARLRPWAATKNSTTSDPQAAAGPSNVCCRRRRSF